MLGIALAPDNILEIFMISFGLVSTVVGATFFFASFSLTHKYGIRFQRRLDRRDFADAILENRIQDIERFLATSHGFSPRDLPSAASLDADDSSLIH
jgi:hypothetical protein